MDRHVIDFSTKQYHEVVGSLLASVRRLTDDLDSPSSSWETSVIRSKTEGLYSLLDTLAVVQGTFKGPSEITKAKYPL